MFKNFFTLFLVLFVFSVLTFDVFAQDGSQPPTFCFIASHCLNAESSCSSVNQGNGHIAKLTIDPKDKPLPNSRIYVVEVISTANGQYYTSGNVEIDNHLTYSIPNDLGYRFEGLFREDGTTPINQTLLNPLKTNGNGSLLTNEGNPVSALEWGDYTPEGHERKWFGFSIAEHEPTVDPNLGLGGQQLGEPVLDWVGASQKCLSIAWDPDGRVFDSQSLEPIPGTSVTLTKKRANGIFSFVNKFDSNDVPTGVLINPYLTLEDGGFSFFVPDGTYKLTPQITGYNFPSSLTLNSNYSKVYSDIYPLLTGLEIVEKGGPQRRDIPVDSVRGQPTYFPIKMMEYSYQSDRMSSVFIDGRVSHPLATINAYSVIPDPNNPEAKIRYKLIKTVKTDKVGRFSIVINQSVFDKNKSEMFGEIEAIKADFGLSANDTNPTPAVLKLNPILTYIEGNASYKNQVLPGARVGLVLDSSTKPYYETVADSQGYFKIPSDYIPFMPYKLRYSSGGTVASLTTSKFITDNSTNLKNKKTNFFYPQYSNPKINDSIKKSIVAYNKQLNNNESGSQSGVSGNVPSKSGSKASQSASKNPTFIVIVLVIIVLLIGV
ncbi:MAG: hypothetical protein AAB859_01980 [Patescibacteria group bacterium]